MPGVRIKFLPSANAKLILKTLSVGLAMKKSEIGIDEPAAGPFAQVTPEECRCNTGPKTLKLPVLSPYRKGFSRVTGLCISVVKGFVGNDCAGAPITPEKT